MVPSMGEESSKGSAGPGDRDRCLSLVNYRGGGQHFPPSAAESTAGIPVPEGRGACPAWSAQSSGFAGIQSL